MQPQGFPIGRLGQKRQGHEGSLLEAQALEGIEKFCLDCACANRIKQVRTISENKFENGSDDIGKTPDQIRKQTPENG